MSTRIACRFNATAARIRKTTLSPRVILAQVTKPRAECAADITGLYSATAVLSLICAAPAVAVGGEFGLLEGRSIALIHPLVMAGLFGTTLYTGWLGWQVLHQAARP